MPSRVRAETEEELTTRIYVCAKATARATIKDVRRRLLGERSGELPKLTDEGIRELARISAKLALGPRARLFAGATNEQIIRWFTEVFAEELSRLGVDV